MELMKMIAYNAMTSGIDLFHSVNAFALMDFEI